MDWRNGCIAVDWGTTNRRAYLMDGKGRLLDEFEDDLGILKVSAGGFAGEIAAMRERFGAYPVLLAGMIGSDRGWVEAPYAPCPADLDSLARAISWVTPGEIGIVPGVSIGGTRPDVMRGEEVQALGAIAAGLVPNDALICHPGTHAKWIVMVEGRIDFFRTMMTGELFSLLKTHSILAPQLGQEIAANAAFDAGAADGLEDGDLLSDLFTIRARHALHQDSDGAASYASGLLIGSDVRCGLRLHGGGQVALVGRPELCALYARALEQAGQKAIKVDGAVAFRAGIHALTESF
ncbi:MAG TPA: 2-dehydro-3-deoxygalactonokinase [Allosphingosinicella sp.]